MSAARKGALKALTPIFSGKKTLDQALDAVLPTIVDSRERAFCQHLTYQTVRWRGALDFFISQLARKPIKDPAVTNLLRLGLAQLWPDSHSDYAAVNETVALAKSNKKTAWASGLTNGVLRNFLRQRDELTQALSKDPARFSHPAWLLDQLQADWPDDWEAIAEANNQPPPLWLRVNRLQASTDDYQAQLADNGLLSRPDDSVDSALLLKSAVSVNDLPGFAEGKVSVQDLSAQRAAALLNAKPGDRVLDACAAPGGKTAHILEGTPEIASLTALDNQSQRVLSLRNTLDRLKLICDTRTADATRPSDWWDGTLFDRILVDAPCSGTGVIRRHPDIRWLREPDQFDALGERQINLLNALWPLLKPGGRLVYATCSVLSFENADVIDAFTSGLHDVEIQPIELPCGRRSGLGWQLFPENSGGDGFFYAILEKSQ